jgi:hypothetical protein
MSRETQNEEEAVDSEKFKTMTGISIPDIDITNNGVLDSVDTHKRQYDPETQGKRIVELYTERDEFIREMLDNAEMAEYVRAVEMLVDAGYDEDELKSSQWTMRDVMQEAKQELGYEPVIEVTYSEKESDHTLIISDNGVGIPVYKYKALRDVGYSGWNDVANGVGMHGQGTMSGFLGSGVYSKFGMITNAYETGETYGVEWRLDQNNELPKQREEPGTTFFWPSFCYEAEEEVDVADAVEEYSEGLRVPVKYEHYDEDGNLVDAKSDEFESLYLEDTLPDHALVVTYEDEFVKLVWSPKIKRPKTFNVAHPTKRNDGKYSTRNKSYQMPSGYHLRIKQEAPKGFVYECPSQPELEGRKLVGEGKLDQIDEDERDEYVSLRDVPDDTIFTPSVTGDRGSFENTERVQAFSERVSEKARENLREQCAELFRSIDSFRGFVDVEGGDAKLLDIATKEFLTVYSKNDPDRLQTQIKNEFDADIPMEAIKRYDDMDDTVSLAPRKRNPSSVGRRHNRTEKNITDVLQLAGEDGQVYMQQRLTHRPKVALAWELHENNQVVQVSTRKYDEYREKYGWKVLKELPTSGFEDAFPEHDFDDDWLDKYDGSVGASTSTTSSSSSVGPDLSDLDFDEERAKKRRLKVRTGTGGSNFKKGTGEHVHDVFDGDVEEVLGAKHLVVYDANEYGASAGTHLHTTTQSPTAYAVVPKYVRDYLLQASRVFTEAQYKQFLREQEIEFSADDSGSAQLRELDERDVLYYDPDADTAMDIVSEFENHDVDLQDVISTFERETGQQIDRVATVDREAYHHALHKDGLISDEIDATVVDSSTYISDYESDDVVERNDLFFETVAPNVDRTAIEWKKVSPNRSETELIELFESICSAEGLPSNDDEIGKPDVPDVLDKHDVNRYIDERHIYMQHLVEQANDELSGGGV